MRLEAAAPYCGKGFYKVNYFFIENDKDRTHHWSRVNKVRSIGCWTDPFTYLCTGCGSYKGAGASPVNFECTGHLDLQEEDYYMDFTY